MSLNKEYAQMVQEQVRSYPFLLPLQCGIEFKSLPKKKSRWMSEYTYLQQMAEEQQWNRLPELWEPLHDPDTAVIVTDPLEKIIWVNKGFSRMTGYNSKEVKGRKPDFLQGAETSPEDVREVRRRLEERKAYQGSLLNYRKSGEAYYCHISVTPLFNRQQELVNFLAVEKEAYSR
ncbi:PAS domain-containing protein [Nafulsella turpanensis]|uniref:PAS domain-containing protein n=1 Tax=Nafulsella turpanensis TaxID=1265690 RepID=UPI00034B1D54|nr:PAS domain-containing protein [Nafulsella turpanensis]